VLQQFANPEWADSREPDFYLIFLANRTAGAWINLPRLKRGMRMLNDSSVNGSFGMRVPLVRGVTAARFLCVSTQWNEEEIQKYDRKNFVRH
jgi:hypothetical protein